MVGGSLLPIVSTMPVNIAVRRCGGLVGVRYLGENIFTEPRLDDLIMDLVSLGCREIVRKRLFTPTLRSNGVRNTQKHELS